MGWGGGRGAGGCICICVKGAYIYTISSECVSCVGACVCGRAGENDDLAVMSL